MGTGPSGRQSGLHSDCVAQAGGTRLRTFRWREHRGDTVAVALLLVLPALFFWSGLADPASIIREDAASYFQPFYALANREIAAGRIPLWDPYLLLGVPFHASCFPSIFYPLRWPLFAMDFVTGHLLLIWSHYFLTGLAAYLLMRVAVKVRAPAALIGAVGITYGGFALGHMPHLPWVMSYPWFITAIMFTWLNQVRPRWYWCAGGGMSIGLIALTGAIHLLLVLAVWLGTFVVYHTAVEVVQFVRRRSSGYAALARPATLVVATCVLGGLIGAIQLLPARAMIKGSAREAPSWAFINTACADPVRNSIQLAVPFFFGNHRTGYWGEHLYHGMAHYSGGVVLLASMLGMTCLGRNRHLWFVVVIAVVGFFVGAGQYLPVYRWLYDWLPGFGQLRNPTRIFWCTDIALACLGAIGIDWLWSSRRATPERRRIRVGVSVAASALLVLVVVWALAQLYSHRDDPTPLVRAIHHVPDDVLRIPARLVNGVRQVAQYTFEKHDALIWGNVAATLAAAVLIPLLVWRRRRPGVFVVMGLVLIETADLFALSLGQAMYDSKHQVVEGVPPRAQWLQENLNEATVPGPAQRREPRPALPGGPQSCGPVRAPRCARRDGRVAGKPWTKRIPPPDRAIPGIADHVRHANRIVRTAPPAPKAPRSTQGRSLPVLRESRLHAACVPCQEADAGYQSGTCLRTHAQSAVHTPRNRHRVRQATRANRPVGGPVLRSEARRHRTRAMGDRRRHRRTDATGYLRGLLTPAGAATSTVRRWTYCRPTIGSCPYRCPPGTRQSFSNTPRHHSHAARSLAWSGCCLPAACWPRATSRHVARDCYVDAVDAAGRQSDTAAGCRGLEGPNFFCKNFAGSVNTEREPAPDNSGNGPPIRAAKSSTVHVQAEEVKPMKPGFFISCWAVSLVVWCGTTVPVARASQDEPTEVTIRGETMKVWPVSDLQERGYALEAIPRDENAAWTYIEAVNAFTDLPEEAAAAFDYALQHAWPDASHAAALAGWITSKENRRAMELARRASEMERCQFPYFGDPNGSIMQVMLPSLGHVRFLAKMLTVDGKRLEAAGKYDEALADYATVSRMGGHVG